METWVKIWGMGFGVKVCGFWEGISVQGNRDLR